MSVLLVPRTFTEFAARVIEIALYIGTVVLLVLALQSPADHATFLNQNFELWMFAEFMAIHSVGMLSARVRQKVPLWVVTPLLLLYVPFFLVPWLVYGQFGLTLLLLGSLVLRVIKIELAPSTLGPDIVVRGVILLFTMFTLSIAIEGMGMLFPQYMATSDPYYMTLMSKFGGIVWAIEYYCLLALASMWLLWADRHPRLVYDRK